MSTAWVYKKNGKWRVGFYDQAGIRRQVSPKKNLKKSAEKLARAKESEVEHGTFVPRAEIPTFAEIAQEWLEYKKPHLRASTWEVYRGHLESKKDHFKELKPLLISKVNVAMVEKWIRTQQDKGMNLATLRKILVTMNQILAYAVRHGFLHANPVRDAERPRDQGQEGDAQAETDQERMKILRKDQIKPFLEIVDDMKYRTLFTLATFGGLRQGEILGAKWGDVDWTTKQINVQRTFNKGRFFSPKTKKSKRKVDLGPFTIKALKEWRLACPKTELDLMFPSKKGTPINYTNLVRRQFHPALEKAGIPRIRFHDLRHTYVSLQIDRGENVVYISRQAGHSNPTVTLNVYSHLMTEANPEAAEKLEAAVFGG